VGDAIGQELESSTLLVTEEGGSIRYQEGVGGGRKGPRIFGDCVRSTFSLGAMLSRVAPERREACLELLTDLAQQRGLERGGVINWHPGCSRLVAMKVCVAHKRQHYT
jgi:hypothetical protein